MILGSIVSSFLSPAQFLHEAKDLPTFDPHRSKWLCLTDAGGIGVDISTTDLGRATNVDKSPSMLGMFQRGVDGVRSPGDRQDDALQAHAHRLTEEVPSASHAPGNGGGQGFANGNYTHHVFETRPELVAVAGSGAPRVADETRPRNVAVHYYLRVNR